MGSTYLERPKQKSERRVNNAVTVRFSLFALSDAIWAEIFSSKSLECDGGGIGGFFGVNSTEIKIRVKS